MTDDLVKRLYNLPSYEEGVEDLAEEAADRIELLERQLQQYREYIAGIRHAVKMGEFLR